MKSLKIATLVVTLFIGTNGFSQDYFVANNDTTFCKDLDYTTNTQGFLIVVSYTDSTGSKIKIEGKKKVPDVQTFYKKGVFIDKTPVKANKPDSYIRYEERDVDGKLIVYLGERGNASSTYIGKNTLGNPTLMKSSGYVGKYRFYLKMPDGTFYQINSEKNIRKYIEPYLMSCSEFESEYKGDVYDTSEEAFMATIRLYNSLCK